MTEEKTVEKENNKGAKSEKKSDNIKSGEAEKKQDENEKKTAGFEKEPAVKEASEAADKKTTKKKKMRRQVVKGQAHIQCTYNNTIITFSDLGGKVLAWCSAGTLGFKGAKKATPYAATQIVNAAAEKVSRHGLREIEVFVKGVGSGREASIRALVNNDFEISLIKDITPIPHNGCRPKKPRRV